MTPPLPAHRPRVWREPTAALALRWGDAATRWWAGTWLIVGGGVAIAGSNTFALWFLAIGIAAHIAGWCLLPSAGWRRVVAVGPSLLAMLLLLSGARFVIVLAVPYLCWLLVRHRPPLAFLTVVPLIAAALLVGDAAGEEPGRMLPALATMAAILVADAWLARLIALHGDARRS